MNDTDVVNQAPRVLVVEDDYDMRTILTDTLRPHGYKVFLAEDGYKAKELIDVQVLDVALLDIMLPGLLSGMEVLEYLKMVQPAAQAIMLTCRNETDLVVEAMRKKAINYIVKMPALSKIITAVQEAWAIRQAYDKIQIGDLQIHRGTGEAIRAGHPLSLTTTERQLLSCLAQQRGETLTYKALWAAVWQYDTPLDKHLVQRTMNNLRAKTGKDIILNVRNKGYTLL